MRRVLVITTENGMLLGENAMIENRVDSFLQKVLSRNNCELNDILYRDDGYLFDCTNGFVVRVHVC